jgi:hypothetical protein
MSKTIHTRTHVQIAESNVIDYELSHQLKNFKTSYKITFIHRLPLLSLLFTNVMKDSVSQLSNIRTVHLTHPVATKERTAALKRAYVCNMAIGNVSWLKRRATTASPFPQSDMICLSEEQCHIAQFIEQRHV